MRTEGFKGFFKGMAAPVAGSVPYNSLVFVLIETCKRKLTDMNLGGWIGSE